MTHRIPLAAFLALGLSACAPTNDGEDKKASPPLTYELALAKQETSEVASSATEARVIDLSPQQVRAKIEAGNVRLIDVRTAEEVAEGAIPGADHIPLDQFDPAKLDPGDEREIVLYCRSGRRSGIAGERLAQHIGAPSQHLEGGFLAWREAGFETTDGL